IISVFIAVIFFGLGYITSKSHKQLCPQTTNEQKGDFQAGWDAAKQRLSETGFMPMLDDIESMEIKTANGEVTEINGNKISVKIYPLEPLADLELDNRVVEVDENTKVYQSVVKDQKEFQKELDEFRKKIDERINNPEGNTGPLTPPSGFIKKETNLAAIKIGQQITVTAEQDIKNLEQFKAIEIIIQSEAVEGATN
ncbi:hypothetical protein KJ973_02800, partial [Patescibacteria group bacterium]|nr:hypothetical protein [Patescibacteria group bacterium]MBU1519593.1 hypothetical protein [Patescibacteria group bacterium]MBU2460922.1 hypothetical protein [Patescibacteria group bacterium]